MKHLPASPSHASSSPTHHTRPGYASSRTAYSRRPLRPGGSSWPTGYNLLSDTLTEAEGLARNVHANGIYAGSF
ncbi:hypothetical protein [Hymenobacter koreensis]|uniref:Uncharacterized protein n=1 Tax=Hymenobacter koreensis TaxID=1084523 RepID=A0ABP8J6P4_9BACT